MTGKSTIYIIIKYQKYTEEHTGVSSAFLILRDSYRVQYINKDADLNRYDEVLRRIKTTILMK